MKRRIAFLFLVVAVATVVMPASSQAAFLSLTETLQPETPVEGADFGRVVAGTHDDPSGPIAVTSFLPFQAPHSGVYVFVPKPEGGWRQRNVYRFVPEAGSFGDSLAITKRHLIVGIPDFGGDDGRVNIYAQVEGDVSGPQPDALLQQLGPEIIGGEEFFGRVMDLRNDVLVLGAPGGEVTSVQKVYVYRLLDDTWFLEQILRQPHDRSSSERGRTLATDGTRIAATGPDGTAFVYVHTGANWIIEQEFDRNLLAGADTEGLEQASAIGINDNWLAISTPGAIHMFMRTNNMDGNVWAETQSISIPAPVTDPSHSLALLGNRMIVGLPSQTRALVYEVRNGSWQEVKTLVPDGTAPGESFGRSIAFGNDRAIVATRGAAYVFRSEGAGSLDDGGIGAVTWWFLGLLAVTKRLVADGKRYKR